MRRRKRRGNRSQSSENLRITALSGQVALASSGAGDWKETGVCDPVIRWDADQAQWSMLYSGVRQGYGWSVGHTVSPDLLQWTEDPSNPLIRADPGGVQPWTSGAGKTLNVADASSFREDAIVIVRNGSTTEAWGLSRVRRISGNELELYHEVSGVGGASSERLVALLGSGSITPRALVPNEDGTFRLYVTAFQPFILDAGSFGNCELVGSLVAPSVLGPWQWDDLGNPQVPPNRWSAERAQENLGLVHHPVNSAP